jgi:hypothetical protein
MTIVFVAGFCASADRTVSWAPSIVTELSLLQRCEIRLSGNAFGSNYGLGSCLTG